MSEKYITCPNCGTQTQTTEPSTQKAVEKLRKEFETESTQKEKEFEGKLAKNRTDLEKQARKQAEGLVAAEIKDLTAQLEERSILLEKARAEELILRKQMQELEERGMRIRLEASRTIDEERNKIRDEVESRVAEESQLRDLEKNRQLADMQIQIEELKGKLEKCSGQAKGETKEIGSDDILRYLSGEEFRERIQAIVESFAAMKKDLDTERQAMEKIWAKRDKQIQRIVQNTAGMYGDIQGIIGSSLPPIKSLELNSGDE
ncbi:MAG TPA: DUF2130 domain-containing protein [Nitrospiria bacterium]|nr:DUF2130 domain-containing protein [Nitrospiria bacterium]